MNLQQLNNELTYLLKEYIDYMDHIDTGALYRSIKFTSTFDGEDLDITFKSEYYITYLDKGEFIYDFFETQEVLDAIEEFYIENLELDI